MPDPTIALRVLEIEDGETFVVVAIAGEWFVRKVEGMGDGMLLMMRVQDALESCGFSSTEMEVADE